MPRSFLILSTLCVGLLLLGCTSGRSKGQPIGLFASLQPKHQVVRSLDEVRLRARVKNHGAEAEIVSLYCLERGILAVRVVAPDGAVVPHMPEAIPPEDLKSFERSAAAGETLRFEYSLQSIYMVPTPPGLYRARISCLPGEEATIEIVP
jgi:hypothetical protein